MKTERVYMHPGKTIPKVPELPLGETVPCLLFVTSEIIRKDDDQYGIKYSIRGRLNPLPFKECIVPRTAMSISIEKWIEKNGWIEVGRNYVK